MARAALPVPPGRDVMPGLNSSLLDTAIPGTTRRRTWSHPEVTSHTLLVLTFNHLYLTALTGDPRPETLAAVEEGADLDEVLGTLATVVDLTAMRRVNLDLLTNALVIEYAGSGLGKGGLRLTFATPEAADTCFTRLWRRLGDRFQLAPTRQDGWQLARGPLALLAGILLATALVALGLSVWEDMASTHAAVVDAHAVGESGTTRDLPTARGTSLLGWLNWKFACGIGGVAAAISQVWLYRRLTTPPTSLELIRT